jgi:hypothetical protein
MPFPLAPLFERELGGFDICLEIAGKISVSENSLSEKSPLGVTNCVCVLIVTGMTYHRKYGKRANKKETETE